MSAPKRKKIKNRLKRIANALAGKPGSVPTRRTRREALLHKVGLDNTRRFWGVNRKTCK